MYQEKIGGFCPTCNCLVAAEVKGEASGSPTEDLMEHLTPGEDGFHGVRYAIAFCPGCNGVFLERSTTTEPSDYQYREILFPPPLRRAVSGLPESLRRAFDSAASCLDTGNYDACLVMCRKCLDGVCALLGAGDKNLKESLKKLRESREIDGRLLTWANQLRLTGNEAAHDLDSEVSREDARDSLEFVEAILLYTFTLKHRFSRFQERREARKAL